MKFIQIAVAALIGLLMVASPVYASEPDCEVIEAAANQGWEGVFITNGYYGTCVATRMNDDGEIEILSSGTYESAEPFEPLPTSPPSSSGPSGSTGGGSAPSNPIPSSGPPGDGIGGPGSYGGPSVHMEDGCEVTTYPSGYQCWDCPEFFICT